MKNARQSLTAPQRLFNPQDIDGDNLIAVSVAGFLVNMVGLFFFHDQ